MAATWARFSCPLTGSATRLISSTTAATAFSMPSFSWIGLAPASTFLNPSLIIVWARMVAVVVPSPATSLVLVATSRSIWAPVFSQWSSSSISRTMVTPSLVTVGAPNFFSSTAFRPFGPRVIRTDRATVSMPRLSPCRASTSKETAFGTEYHLLHGQLLLDGWIPPPSSPAPRPGRLGIGPHVRDRVAPASETWPPAPLGHRGNRGTQGRPRNAAAAHPSGCSPSSTAITGPKLRRRGWCMNNIPGPTASLTSTIPRQGDPETEGHQAPWPRRRPARHPPQLPGEPLLVLEHR